MAEQWPRKVRTTMRPDVTVEVDQTEYEDLRRQGLLLSEPEKGPSRPERSEP